MRVRITSLANQQEWITETSPESGLVPFDFNPNGNGINFVDLETKVRVWLSSPFKVVEEWTSTS